MLQDSSTEDLPPSDRAKLLASLADAFTKTVSANARVMPETSKLATALELIEFLMAFVQEKHPKHLPAFVEVLEPFWGGSGEEVWINKNLPLEAFLQVLAGLIWDLNRLVLTLLGK